MSGGSYNYMCTRDIHEIVDMVQDTETSPFYRMTERLQHNYPDSRAAKDMTELKEAIVRFLEETAPKVAALVPVWESVEWVDSGDRTEDELVKDIREYGLRQAMSDYEAAKSRSEVSPESYELIHTPPVVAAPEPGPWQSLNDVPAEVSEVWGANGDRWLRRSNTEWFGCAEGGITSACRAGHPNLAPFRASPTETGPWYSCDEVPDGIWFTSRRTPWYQWVNRDGVRYYSGDFGPHTAENPMRVSKAKYEAMEERAPFIRVDRVAG